MPTQQGSVALLNDPVAQQLLHSTNLARLAYTWPDGTPRVIPIWFHWNGHALVLGTPLGAPKVHVLPHNSKVALTIDADEWPYKVLLIRGTAEVETVDGVVPEYAAAAERYFGAEQGRAWLTMCAKCPHKWRASRFGQNGSVSSILNNDSQAPLRQPWAGERIAGRQSGRTHSRRAYPVTERLWAEQGAPSDAGKRGENACKLCVSLA